jgi:low affinity Fe/Cu permease
MVKNIQPHHKKLTPLEKMALRIPGLIGTPMSLVVHTFFFAGIFLLGIFGFSVDQIMLILTTAVSLEAIYLSILIQMTVNRQGKSIADIEEDIEDIQEDVEELSDGVEDISEDIDEYHGEEEGQIKKLVKKGISELRSKHII